LAIVQMGRLRRQKKINSKEINKMQIWVEL
jgi:hypothetical protein